MPEFINQKTYFWIFFYVLFIPTIFGQTRTNMDSLWSVYQTTKEDTAKIIALGDIAYNYREGNPDSTILLSEQALEMARAIDFKKGMAKSLYNLGEAFYFKGEYQISSKHLNKSLEIYTSLRDNIEAAKCLFYLGLDSYLEGDYSLAISKFRSALDLLASEKKSLVNVNIFNLLGHTYTAQKDYSFALEWFKKSIALAPIVNYKLGEGEGYSGIGVILLFQDSLHKAKENFEKSLQLYEEIGNKRGLSYSLTHIGEIYVKQKKYAAALIEFQEGLRINAKIDDLGGKNKILIGMGQLYFHLKKYDEAQTTLEKVFHLAKKINNLRQRNTAANYLQLVHAAKKQYKTALYYGEIYQMTKDSLFSIETKKTIEQFRFVYKTKEKEKENEALAQKNEIQELQIKNNRYSLLFMAIGIIITLLLALLLYFQQQNAKKTAMQEKAYSHKLEKVNKLRTNLFANIAHDFRTPLSLLVTPLQEMKEGRFQNNYQHYYSLMLTNARQLMTLVEQMLDLAKLDEGKMKLNKTKNDITLFARNHLMQFESMASHKNIELQLHCPKSPIEITFDRDKMSKIWNNLIDNALKFTPRGGKVSLELNYQTNGWTLSVKDNGKGMSAKELTSIFTRYYRGYQDGNGTTGGLGLALVKQLTELHQGQIKVSSELDQGSTFLLTFPYAEKINLPAWKEKQTITFNAIQAASSLKKLIRGVVKPVIPLNPPLLNEETHSILIVEDNRDLNQLISERLGIDYHILQAFNGLEGLEIATSRFPDFILTDLMMPGMDGFDFVERLNQSSANHIPVIIISALDKEVNDYQLWKEGIVDFISKPIDFKELKFKLDNIISNKKRFQQNLIKNLPYILPETAFTNIPDTDKELFKQFHQLVLKQLSDSNLNIDDLAKQLLVSRRLFHQKILSTTGLPPATYIRTIRIKKGKELLERANGRSIREIAMDVGIPNPSHFSKLFKQEFGISPKELGRSLKNNN